MKHKIVADVTGTKLMDNSGTRVKDRLKAHTPVEILEANARPFNQGTWTKVKTGEGQTGWVDADHVVQVA